MLIFSFNWGWNLLIMVIKDIDSILLIDGNILIWIMLCWLVVNWCNFILVVLIFLISFFVCFLKILLVVVRFIFLKFFLNRVLFIFCFRLVNCWLIVGCVIFSFFVVVVIFFFCMVIRKYCSCLEFIYLLFNLLIKVVKCCKL